MKTYAYIRDGIVVSHFTTKRPVTDFPDIAEWLHEAPDDVQDGMAFDGKQYAKPAQEETKPSSEDRIAALEAKIAEMEKA